MLPQVEACRCRRARAQFSSRQLPSSSIFAVTGVNRKTDTRELLRPRVQYVFGQGAYDNSPARGGSLCETTDYRRPGHCGHPDGVQDAHARHSTPGRGSKKSHPESDGDFAGVPVGHFLAATVVAACRVQPSNRSSAPSEEKECDGLVPGHQCGCAPSAERDRESGVHNKN